MYPTLKNHILHQNCIIKEIFTTEQCDDFFKSILNTNEIIFGLDVEFSSLKSASICQVATKDKIGIIRIAKIQKEIESWPDSMKSFFEDPNKIKTGRSIFNDVEILQKTFQFQIKSCVDISSVLKLSKNVIIRPKSSSLHSLCKYFLGITLSASPANWDSDDPLTDLQMSYAASDAWYSLQLFYLFWKLSPNSPNSMNDIDIIVKVADFQWNNKYDLTWIKNTFSDYLVNFQNKMISSSSDTLTIPSSLESKSEIKAEVKINENDKMESLLSIFKWLEKEIDDKKLIENFVHHDKNRKIKKKYHKTRANELSRFLTNFSFTSETRSEEFEHLESMAVLDLQLLQYHLNLFPNLNDSDGKNYQNYLRAIIHFCIAYRRRTEIIVCTDMLQILKLNLVEFKKIKNKIDSEIQTLKIAEKTKKREIRLIKKQKLT